MKKPFRDLLFNYNFHEEVENYLQLFNPIYELINKCQNADTSVAEAVHLWLNLGIPKKFPVFQLEIANRKKMALNIFALAAYSLHLEYTDLAEIKLFLGEQQYIQNFFIE